MFGLSILSMLGKRDFIYIAIIAGILIMCYVGKAHYESLVAESKQEVADCRIEQANLSNKLSESTRKLEVEKDNYTQCKQGMIGYKEYMENYALGAARSKRACEDQLTACINAKPSIPVNTKDGTRGVNYEDGKESDRRIRDRLLGPSDGMSKRKP